MTLAVLGLPLLSWPLVLTLEASLAIPCPWSVAPLQLCYFSNFSEVVFLVGLVL